MVSPDPLNNTTIIIVRTREQGSLIRSAIPSYVHTSILTDHNIYIEFRSIKDNSLTYTICEFAANEHRKKNSMIFMIIQGQLINRIISNKRLTVSESSTFDYDLS